MSEAVEPLQRGQGGWSTTMVLPYQTASIFPSGQEMRRTAQFLSAQLTLPPNIVSIMDQNVTIVFIVLESIFIEN